MKTGKVHEGKRPSTHKEGKNKRHKHVSTRKSKKEHKGQHHTNKRRGQHHHPGKNQSQEKKHEKTYVKNVKLENVISGCKNLSWVEGMDLTTGEATLTQYGIAPTGTFNVNQDVMDALKGKGYVFMAAPFGWFQPQVNLNRGNCENGIFAANKNIPTLGNGEPLCFHLTNEDGKSVNGIVVETCGGNCCGSKSRVTDDQKRALWEGDCARYMDPSDRDFNDVKYAGMDCRNPGKNLTKMIMYDPSYRSYPQQACEDWAISTTASKVEEYKKQNFFTDQSVCGAEKTGDLDWCSGVWAHFDIGIPYWPLISPKNGRGDGKANFTRIVCPDEVRLNEALYTNNPHKPSGKGGSPEPAPSPGISYIYFNVFH